MATGCIWLGTARGCRVLASPQHKLPLQGRGSEVSLITPKETAVVEANEGVYQYQILQTGIQRQKDGPSRTQFISHRDGVLKISISVKWPRCNGRM
jgi:hypothetical protein